MTPMTNPDIQHTYDHLPRNDRNSNMERPSCLYNTGLSLHQLSRDPSWIGKGVADSPVNFDFGDSREEEQILVRRSQITQKIIYAQQPSSPPSWHPTYANDDSECDEAKVALGPRGRQDHTCPDDAEKQKLRDRVESLERQAQEYNERYDAATETVTVLPRTFVQAVSTPSEPYTDREIKKEKTAVGSSKDQRRTREGHPRMKDVRPM
jgi:hypothetical protein